MLNMKTTTLCLGIQLSFKPFIQLPRYANENVIEICHLLRDTAEGNSQKSQLLCQITNSQYQIYKLRILR